MNLSDSQRRVARWVVALVVLGIVVYVLHPWPRTGADQVKHAVSWPSSCESVSIDAPRRGSTGYTWPEADQMKRIQCQVAGPQVTYATFDSSRTRDRVLASRPPHASYCTYGKAVVVNGLDSGFDRVCDRLDGRLVSRPATKGG